MVAFLSAKPVFLRKQVSKKIFKNKSRNPGRAGIAGVAGRLGLPAKNIIFFEEGSFFPRASPSFFFGVLFAFFGGVFVLLGGVFVIFGGVFVLFCFARQRKVFWGS